MDHKQVTVVLEPDGIKLTVRTGTTILEAANEAGIILNAVCGGAGTCNKCLVEIVGEKQKVKACQTKIERSMTIAIPTSSRFFEQKILQDGITKEGLVSPLVCKHYVQVSEPSLQDLRSDATRLIDAVLPNAPGCHGHDDDSAGTVKGEVTLATDLLSKLPSLFRNNGYAATAVCHSGRIFALEAGDTRAALYGAAVDLGTTTVVAQLVDLTTGKTVGTASANNPQVAFGDDVISRIKYSGEQADGLKILQRRILDCVNQLIKELCEKNVVSPWQIYELTAAGNATMQHLFLGIPAEQIAQAPYVSVFSAGINTPAEKLGIDIHPAGNVYVMPSVAAHVGGDTVAVALATAMIHSEKINLGVDIGTNGELILGNRDGLLVCSTAAGPAFEGARIEFGMRGAAGAIERVYLNDDVELGVIGQGKPSGICGSGLIDTIAELYRVGIMDMTGRLQQAEDVPSLLSAAIKARLVMHHDKPAFLLASKTQTAHGKDIVLTQRDIREAQLGKAAIKAGILTLLKERAVRLEDVDKLYLAGAFGNYIRAESATRMGLLPEEFPLERIQFVGNAAGVGAKDALLNRAARREAERIGREARYVELAGRGDFQMIYSEAMLFGAGK